VKKLFFLLWTGPCLLALTLSSRFLYHPFDSSFDSLLVILSGLVLLKNRFNKLEKALLVFLSLSCVYAYHSTPLFLLSLAMSLVISSHSIGFLRQLLEDFRSEETKAKNYQRLLDESLKIQNMQKDKLDALFFESSVKDEAIESLDLDACIKDIQDKLELENELELLEKEVQKKEQKRPLRRLQKAVMKQTSFFDET